MELLAFTHAAAGYEDPAPAPELRSAEEMLDMIPSSAWMGMLSFAVFASVLTINPQSAQAALCMRGDSGPAVKAIQETLVDNGYLVSVDSVFGLETENAVRAFQRDNGLFVDGKAGGMTLEAMGLGDVEGSLFGSGTECNAGDGGGGGGDTAVVTASALNVRSTPNGTVVGTVYSGTTVTLSGEFSFAGGLEWAELANGGWVATDFLDFDGGGSGGGSDTAVVTASALNVRNEPNGFVVGTVFGGTTVTLSGEFSFAGGLEWAELTGGGWVATDFLDFDGGGSGGGTPSDSAVVTASALNVRNAPDGSVVGTVFGGTTVTLTGASEFAGGLEWVELTNGGWVAADFLDFGGTGGGGGVPGDSAFVTASFLNVRDQPAGFVVGGVVGGTTVPLSGAFEFAGGREWAELSGGGWVATDFLSF
jgi:peptidoglycan hydrolase-like protein with peptidoglycan-binding domain